MLKLLKIVMCKHFSYVENKLQRYNVFKNECFTAIVASVVSKSDTVYVCHGHVIRNAKSREHTYACIVSPYVCVFVLEKLLGT